MRKADAAAGPLAHGLVQPPRAAYDKTGPAPGVVVHLAQQVGQLGRGKVLAAFVEHQGDILRVKGLNDAASFKGVALVLGQGRIAVTHFGYVQLAPAGNARGVVGSGILPERRFQLAHTYVFQGFASHVFSSCVK